ncbi:hypothetical protein SESBI_06481 [Sesbania bispinosa]|nr:hypothetical protein SESBI_06481 [Sesbania bispinosa]
MEVSKKSGHEVEGKIVDERKGKLERRTPWRVDYERKLKRDEQTPSSVEE